MRVREDVCYRFNYTFTGKQMLVGIKGINSFVKFNYQYADRIVKFINQYKNKDIRLEDLTSENKIIYDNFNKLGYLNNGIEPKESFNEFKKMGKSFFEFFPKSESKETIGSSRIGIFGFTITTILLALFVVSNRSYLPKSIDYIHMHLWEIYFTIGIFPWAVLAIHELGHCLMAKYVGVKIANVSLGWFFIYPIVLVQYHGLNLESQSKKSLVMLGGVYFNFLMVVLGVFMKSLFPHLIYGAVIDIWISANISTIITNMGLFGMTDGYFLVTMWLGITDIRLKGYKYLNSIFNRRKQSFGRDYKVCGGLLSVLFITGLISLIINIDYWTRLMNVSNTIVFFLVVLFIVILTFRFVLRIKKSF